jgi:hypothetical protein
MTDMFGSAGWRQMRVSDADRERVVDALRLAAGEGRLTLSELGERIAWAYAATTYADIDAVTSDLPPPGTAAPSPAPPGIFPPECIGGTPGAKVSVAFMSGKRRSGWWVVPHLYTVVAVMGRVELDLRYARFGGREVTIRAYALMGEIGIVVPSDIGVDISGVEFMGGFSDLASGPGLPGAPRLKVTSLALMGGGIDIRRKPAKTLYMA